MQLIKWVQEQAGVGSARVRAPRLELHGPDLLEAESIYAKGLATRPTIPEVPFPR